MKKYPVIKCDEKLWEEIKKQLDIWKVPYYNVSNDWREFSYLVSNFGCPQTSTVGIGSTYYFKDEVINAGYRYLVNTKEEFLSTIAKLLNEEYTMEERNVKVSLEKAREWYKSGGTLKEIALQAFTKDELEELPKWEEISTLVLKNTPSCMVVPTKELRKWAVIHKLAIIAEYLNEGWRPDWTDNNKAKYYIFKDFQIKEIQIAITYSCSHGNVYFKTKELAEKAIKILGKEIEYIFD